jgi:hypothetical protein
MLQVPSKSVNLKSINFTLPLIILLTSDGVLSLAICWELLLLELMENQRRIGCPSQRPIGNLAMERNSSRPNQRARQASFKDRRQAGRLRMPPKQK